MGQFCLSFASLHFARQFQGSNEVYFFITDPIFLPKFLNPDPKNDENFYPWTRKIWSLIPHSVKNTADPDPARCDSRSQGCDSWSRAFSGLWSLIPYISLRPCQFYTHNSGSDLTEVCERFSIELTMKKWTIFHREPLPSDTGSTKYKGWTLPLKIAWKCNKHTDYDKDS